METTKPEGVMSVSPPNSLTASGAPHRHVYSRSALAARSATALMRIDDPDEYRAALARHASEFAPRICAMG